ncbi:MAG: beta-lactamase family protein [Actinomycetales bacterium]|nr:beta-lactamase family protein [Actinomycetales bacterium]
MTSPLARRGVPVVAALALALATAGALAAPAAASPTASTSAGHEIARLANADDSPGPGPDAGIEAVLDRELPASGAPGVAYAVVTDGELSAVGARGVAELGSGRTLADDTPFSIGSVTKSVTAVAILQLVEAGEVDLDASFARYLPAFAGGPAEPVTVRQLLGHTSGYSTLQGNTSHAGGSGSDALARAVDALASTAPANPPGERWEYSNTNYQILGRLIEVVSGEDYAGYVTAHVLEPIGMRDSFVADGAVHDEAATGHRPWFFGRLALRDRATDRATAPQGGVWASARDLARYLGVLMNGRDDVLSAADKALMTRPASAVSPFYGLGWFLDDTDGTVGHDGSTPGFESLATMLPAQNRAVVVLVNAGSGIGFGETLALREAVTAEGLGLAAPAQPSRLGQQALFVGLLALPLFYLAVAAWAIAHRDALRAKRRGGAAGWFSLLFPVLTTAVAAWVIVELVPSMLGAPLGTLARFQPDLGVALVASAVLGVAWAVLRLVLALTGRAPAPDAPATDAPVPRPSTA